MVAGSFFSCKDKLVCSLMVAVLVALGMFAALLIVLFYFHRRRKVCCPLIIDMQLAGLQIGL
jgi:hypothetical protein